jgi:hypothetical protein
VATPPLASEGDYWRYRGRNQHGPDHPTYKVTRAMADGMELNYDTNRNEHITLVLNRDWNPTAQRGQDGAAEVNFAPAAAVFEFPLTPGKHWQGTYKGDCGALCSFEVAYEGEVRGWETVTVPAGSFRALRIVSRENYRYVFGMKGLGIRTLWLAPEVRHPVKFSYLYEGKMIQDYELEAYQVAQ